MIHFVFIVTYLGKMLVIEWEIKKKKQLINVNFSLFYSSFVRYSCLILFIKFLVGEVQISACTHLLIWSPQLSLSLGKFFFYIIKVYIIIIN